MKKTFLFSLLVLFSCNLKKDTLPNVIVILVDDLGYADLGFTGSNEISTPNIDGLAENGVVFTDGYVSYAVCSPSRAGLVTGRYQDTFGYGLNALYTPKDPNMGLPLSEFTIADLFKTKNYKTLAVGKWHLGAHESLRPLNRGFDEFFGFLTGGHQYFPEQWNLADETEVKCNFCAYRTKLLRNEERIDEKDYLTDALSRETVSFIERSSNSPFFIYLAYNAPHGPLQATEKYLKRYSHIKDKRRKTYAAMVSSIDDGVGDIVSALKEKNIYNNTIIYFLSDNGGAKSNTSNNAPLNSHKGTLYEGGIRIPFVMQWPDEIKGGAIFTKPIISLDIFATSKAIINPDLELKNKIHGKDLLPFIKGFDNGYPHEYLYWRNNGHQPYIENGVRARYITHAVRSKNYKMFIRRGDSMLFDLNSDIGEKNNIIEKNRPLFNELVKKSVEWNKTLMDPIFLGLRDDELYNKLNPDRYIY